MKKSRKELGTIQVLLKRLNEERLPQALELKDKVDGGACLNDYEMRFLAQVFEDAGAARRLSAKHPEFQPLLARLASLYSEITRQALENERKSVEVTADLPVPRPPASDP